MERMASLSAHWRAALVSIAHAVFLASAGMVLAGEIDRAPWFPDQPSVRHFPWTFTPCDGCQPLEARSEWSAMARLAGLGKVRFLLAPGEANGPAYSYPPSAIVLSPSGLQLPPCQQAFLVGHEIVHLAQRHFDEDAHALSVLSGVREPPTWSGEDALGLLDGDFPLARRMSAMWQQQEREADWLGVLLAADAAGCGIADSALSYLGADAGFGGGIAAAHEESARRAAFLQAFTESARRLAARAEH